MTKIDKYFTYHVEFCILTDMLKMISTLFFLTGITIFLFCDNSTQSDQEIVWSILDYEKASYSISIGKIKFATMVFEIEKGNDQYLVKIIIKANLPPLINKYTIEYEVNISKDFDSFQYVANDSDVFKNKQISLIYSYNGGPIEKIRKIYNKKGKLRKTIVIEETGVYPQCEEILFILLLRIIATTSGKRSYNFLYGKYVNAIEAEMVINDAGESIIVGKLYDSGNFRTISDFTINMSTDGHYTPLSAVVQTWFGRVFINSENIVRNRVESGCDR